MTRHLLYTTSRDMDRVALLLSSMLAKMNLIVICTRIVQIICGRVPRYRHH